MANIRIKDLSTTAAVTASDDFIAVDGATNGTRKLNAYSPTFGGNLTVSGTGQQTFSGRISSSHSTAGSSSSAFVNTASNGYGLLAQGGSTLASTQYVFRAANYLNADAFVVYSDSATLAGNLTVSGGTIGTAASTNLTLNGGSSGASLVLGQGTTGDATFSNSANTGFILGANNATSGTGAFSALGLLAGTRQSFIYRFSEGYSSSGYYVAGALVFENNGTSGHMIFADAGSESMRITATNRNLLIGTTTDGGQKLQVAGTAEIQSTLTVKGAEAGPTTGISSIIQNTTSANDRVAALRLVNASNQWNLRAVGSGDTFSIGPGLSGSETNYFTLSSAGNATFAGTIKPQQAATASAPTYVKGAIYFDTTLNKLRVGGATGWETITSV